MTKVWERKEASSSASAAVVEVDRRTIDRAFVALEVVVGVIRMARLRRA